MNVWTSPQIPGWITALDIRPSGRFQPLAGLKKPEGEYYKVKYKMERLWQEEPDEIIFEETFLTYLPMGPEYEFQITTYAWLLECSCCFDRVTLLSTQTIEN